MGLARDWGYATGRNDRGTNVTKSRRAATLLALLALAAPVAAQDAQEADTSGKGAVLCGYTIYLQSQQVTALCEWDRVPGDDAIDRAVTAIEAFIVANSAVPVTAAQLAEARTLNFERLKSDFGPQAEALCSRTNGDPSIEFIAALRAQPPEETDASVADMLSIPRPPLMNPCF